MYLTLTPTAAEYLNNANNALTQNETNFLLWVLVGLVLIVGTLIGVMWNALTTKVGKLDDTMTASLQNQVSIGKDIEALQDADERIESHLKNLESTDVRIERNIDRLDGRILTVERKLGGFMSPPGRGLQEG